MYMACQFWMWSLSIKTEPFKLCIKEYFNFKKGILTNLFTNFSAVIIFGKSSGTIIIEHF